MPGRCRHFTTARCHRQPLACESEKAFLLHYPSQIFEQVGSNKALSRRADTQRLLQSPELFLFRGCKSAGQTHGGRTATQKRAARRRRPLPPRRNGRNSNGGGRRRLLRNDLRTESGEERFQGRQAERRERERDNDNEWRHCWLLVGSSLLLLLLVHRPLSLYVNLGDGTEGGGGVELLTFATVAF